MIIDLLKHCKKPLHPQHGSIYIDLEEGMVKRYTGDYYISLNPDHYIDQWRAVFNIDKNMITTKNRDTFLEYLLLTKLVYNCNILTIDKKISASNFRITYYEFTSDADYAKFMIYGGL